MHYETLEKKLTDTICSCLLDVICFEQEVDLKYNGRNITVTEANKIEYIHLMADYKINKQVYINMTDAFKKSCLHVLNMKISKSKIQSTGIFHFLWSYLLFCGHILGWI